LWRDVGGTEARRWPICAIPRDPKRFYEKLKGAVGPMVTILVEELVRLNDGGRDGRITRIDFSERLPDSIKAHLLEPIV
jgi:hypothetical protein